MYLYYYYIRGIMFIYLYEALSAILIFTVTGNSISKDLD